ncbi:ribosome biogenesis protein Nop53/GLTSCR2 [Gorgonomyces haynaldii]|nr:ribosome biogenesis protein Nop53/GLTSCR2 [Gorgonomyces haynaldii]
MGRKGTKTLQRRKASRATKALVSIEEGLAEKRMEERVGKFADKSNGELFVVDTRGDAKRKTASKTLTMDEILRPKSKVQGLVAKKTTDSSEAVEGSKHRVSKNVKQLIDKLAERKKAQGLGPGASQKAKQAKKQEKQEHLAKHKGGFDLWEDETPIETQPPKKKPAVKIAHPGTSYNPDPEQHKEAIQVAAEPEFKKIKEKEEIEEQLSYPAELDDLDDNPIDEESDEEEEEEVEEDGTPKKKSKRKTKAQRNKKKRTKEERMEKAKQNEQDRINQEIERLEEIQGELTAVQQQQLDQLKERLLVVKKAKLSRYDYKPMPMEIQLPDELADSMRKLKPEGNLFKDRFKSLEERQMIEPRVPVKPRRRYKLKEIESHSYKRFK